MPARSNGAMASPDIGEAIFPAPTSCRATVQAGRRRAGDVQTFAGNGLDPVGFMTCWGGWAEVHIHRRVGICDDFLFLAAHARELPVRLEHRT